MMPTLTITPLHEDFGASITGIDLSVDLDADAVEDWDKLFIDEEGGDAKLKVDPNAGKRKTKKEKQEAKRLRKQEALFSSMKQVKGGVSVVGLKGKGNKMKKMNMGLSEDVLEELSKSG